MCKMVREYVNKNPWIRIILIHNFCIKSAQTKILCIYVQRWAKKLFMTRMSYKKFFF